MNEPRSDADSLAVRSSAARRGRRVRWGRVALVGLASLVVLALVAVGVAYGYARYRYGQIKKVSVPVFRQQQHAASAAHEGGGRPVTILLVGSNSRAALDGTQSKAFGTAAEVGGARSDVTMLLRLDPATGKAALLSIPRDLFIPEAGSRTEQRVDAALNTGPAQLVTTIEDGLGIQIDHYVELNFDSFQHVVNALGGIDMYFPAPIRDSYTGVNVTASGCQHLDGFAALEVVRSRHLYYKQNGVWKYDGWGDLSRIRRDHEFLRVMLAAVEHKGLSNPATLNAVVGDVAPQLTIDSTLSFNTMVSWASRFRHLDPNTIPELTLPVVNAPGYVYKGVAYGDVVLPAQPLDEQTIGTWIADTQPSPVSPSAAPGATAGTATAPSITVDNGTGQGGLAARLAEQLNGLGYPAHVGGSVPVVAKPTETVVFYHPGEATTATALLGVLHGAAAIGADDSVPPGTLTLVAGSGLSVAAPAGTPAGSPDGTVSSATTPVSPVHGVAGTNAIVPNSDPLFFDPTACPAH